MSVAGLSGSSLPVVAADVQSGTNGWMVLSRWPLLAQRTVSLDDRTMPRLVLRRPDGGTVVVWQVHPMAPVAGHVGQWRRQMSVVRAAIAADRSAATPVVVAGDFNASRDLPAFSAFLHDGWADATDGHGLMATWRVGGRLPPLLRLDHVLVSRDVGVERVRRSPSIGSDHLGLIVVLQFARG
jgi:endonuclease/exonuclease/phosphatase (EEP) superfamily protein YafD